MSMIDISPLISEKIAVWPGDVSFKRHANLEIAKGSNIDLSHIQTTVHVGAHADSRSHYLKDGITIDEHALEPYYGPCQVVEVSIRKGERIRVKDFSRTKITAPRVLFKTNSFPNPNIFNQDFNGFSGEVIEYLQEKNCVLIGIDTPSIDPFDDKVLESHHAIAKSNIVNLEGLVLAHVAPGTYTLIALPLKISGGDASPVRAVLIEA